MDDLVKRLRKEMDKFYGKPPCGLLNEAADRIEQLEAALRDINNRLNDIDSWLAQSIDCRDIAEMTIGKK
jgi:hypothetical protein